MEMAEVEYNKIHLSEQLLKQQLKVEEERKRRLEEQIKIASPISGVILKQDIEEGMVITPGTILFIVANLDKLAVKCNIPEVDIGRVKKDMEVRITAETLPGKEFQGKIVKVSPFPMESSNISLFEVVISIEKPFQGLQIGRGVNVEIFSIQEGKSLVVPIEAISIKEDKKMVFVVEDGRAWEREITIGMVDVENKNIEITSGLKEGEEISILAEEELTEGMKVESIKVPERR